MMKRTLSFGLVCFCVAAQAFAQTADYSSMKWLRSDSLSKNMPKGVDIYECSSPLPDGSSFHGVYAHIDLKKNPNIGFESTYTGHGNAYVSPQVVAQNKNKTVNKSFVAINGGYFNTGSTKESLNICVNNGKLLAPYAANRATWGIDREGNSSIHYALTKDNIIYSFPDVNNSDINHSDATVWNPWIALGGGPVVLHDGEVKVVNEGFSDSHCLDRHPRTAIGYKEDGSLVMMVIDGRQAGFASGVNLDREMAGIMQALGANNVVNLDGGGSSVMVVNDEIVNSPSDGEVRPCPVTLMLTQKSHLFDTEDTSYFATQTSDWIETGNAGFYGTSKSLICKTIEDLGKETTATYSLPDNLPAEKYQLRGWWVAATNRSKATPFIIVRENLKNDTVYVDQTQNHAKFNVIGEFHLSPNDKILVSNNAERGSAVTYVTIDAIELTRVAESILNASIAEGDKSLTIVGKAVDLHLNYQSPNSGLKLQTVNVYAGATIESGKLIKTIDVTEGYSGSINISITPLLLGNNEYSIETIDNEGNSLILNHIIDCRSYGMEFESGKIADNHNQHEPLRLKLLLDGESGNISFSSAKIFSIVDGTETLLKNESLSGKKTEVTIEHVLTEKVGTQVVIRFDVTTSTGETSSLPYTASVVAKKGSFRMVALSDLNDSYGSLGYEKQVEKFASAIPGLFTPDMVLGVGDLIAGGQSSHSVELTMDMWNVFDSKVYAPIREANHGFAFVNGNHDAVFENEIEAAKRFWNDKKLNMGIELHDDTNFPFYYSFNPKNKPEVAVIVMNANSTTLSSSQQNWLEEQLKSDWYQSAKFRVVTGHLPLFPTAVDRDAPGGNLAAHDLLLELFETTGVNTYISGHHHAYYLGKRGNVTLLNGGCLGSGARNWINMTMTPTNTITVVDHFFANDEDNPFKKDTTIYNTFYAKASADLNNLKTFEEEKLPIILTTYNGYMMRNDAPLHQKAQSELHPFHQNYNVNNKAVGKATVQIEQNELVVTGTYSDLDFHLIDAPNSIALYKGRHGVNEENPIAIATVYQINEKSGTFEIRTLLTQELHEQLSGGTLYINVRTQKYPNGELRGQVAPYDSKGFALPTINSHDDNQFVEVRDIEGVFNVEWTTAEDFKNYGTTYIYQMAYDAAFKQMIYSRSTDKVTSFRDASEQEIIEKLLTKDDTMKVFQRVLVSDGINIRSTEVQPLTLVKSNAVSDAFIPILAESWSFKQEMSRAHGSMSHGVVVDGEGRIWSVGYAIGIYVTDRNGNPVFFNNPNLTQNESGQITAIKSEVITSPSTGALINTELKTLSGLGLSHDGHILCGRSSTILKINIQTGELMRYYEGMPTTGSNPTAAQNGDVYVSYVLPKPIDGVGESVGGMIIAEEGDYYYKVKQYFDDMPRPGVTRASAITKDGKRCVVPGDALKFYVYTKSEGSDAYNQYEAFDMPNGANKCFAIWPVEDSKVYMLMNKNVIGAQLVMYDFEKCVYSILELKDVIDADIRGLALNNTQTEVYLASASRAMLLNYSKSVAINFEEMDFEYSGKAQEAVVSTMPKGMKLKLSYNGSEVLPINAGLYEVSATIDLEGIQVSKSAFMEIEKKQLDVVVNDTVGLMNQIPDFKVSYIGFVSEEDASVLGGEISYTIAPEVDFENLMDEYNVIANGLTAQNYWFNYIHGKLTFDKVSDIDKNDVNNVIIYNGLEQWFVKFPSIETEVIVNLIDAKGHQIGSYISNDIELEIPHSMLPSGYYLISIESQGLRTTKKVMK